ncbi:class I SAM-dependent methyltransferase [Candidatus Woesearchaeota archaeon]|nr:class I SAM-dependent methyltransferase [Candidatus Woesearchaeota archaeon]
MNEIKQRHKIISAYDNIAQKKKGLHSLPGSISYYFQQKMKTRINSMVSKESSTIADIGCGRGDLSIMMAQTHPHTRVYGLDASIWMIQRAQELKKITKTENVSFSVHDIHFPLQNKYDTTVMLGVLLYISPSALKKVITNICIGTKKEIIIEIKNKHCPYYPIKVFKHRLLIPDVKMYGHTITEMKRLFSQQGLFLMKINPLFGISLLSPTIILKFARQKLLQKKAY